METTAAGLNPEAPLFITGKRFNHSPPITTTLQFPPHPVSFPYHNLSHFLYIYPLLQKPPPPPPPPLHLLPPPSPPTEVLHKTDAHPSTVRYDFPITTLNPAGPRLRSKGDKFRGGRCRVDLNDGLRIPKCGGWNSRERKSTGIKKVLWVKKGTFDTEIIPLREDEEKTTIMIKNIPSKYTREMLMQFLDKHCNEENERAKEVILAGNEAVSAYDFVYLPIDFCSRLSKGYAFVNFTKSNSVWKFRDAFNGESWDYFNSPKRIEIVSAKIQGKKDLLDHFERSHFCCDTDEYLPLELDPPKDGSDAPVRLRPVGNRFFPRRHSVGFNNSRGYAHRRTRFLDSSIIWNLGLR